jgi:hypothetical protein
LIPKLAKSKKGSGPLIESSLSDAFAKNIHKQKQTNQPAKCSQMAKKNANEVPVFAQQAVQGI